MLFQLVMIPFRSFAIIASSELSTIAASLERISSAAMAGTLSTMSTRSSGGAFAMSITVSLHLHSSGDFHPWRYSGGAALNHWESLVRQGFRDAYWLAAALRQIRWLVVSCLRCPLQRYPVAFQQFSCRYPCHRLALRPRSSRLFASR